MEGPFVGTERSAQCLPGIALVLPLSQFPLLCQTFTSLLENTNPSSLEAMSIPITIKATQCQTSFYHTPPKLWSVLSLSFSSHACHRGRVRHTPGAPTMNLTLENRMKVWLTSDIIHYTLFFRTSDFLIAKG